jgi:hypothetical protein
MARRSGLRVRFDRAGCDALELRETDGDDKRWNQPANGRHLSQHITARRTAWQTRSVPDKCTCGATLPPDALFCHRCGKPQREIPGMQEPEPEPALPPPLPAAPAPTPIGFHNGPAVRMALVAGIVSILVLMITGQVMILQLLGPLWLVGGGFLAVYLYCRKTGQRLTPMSGAHLGWIAGIFGFLMMTVILTLIALALSEPAAVATLRSQWSNTGRPEADFNTMLDAFHSPEKVAAILSMILLLFSILPAFGGALGAKFFDRADLARRD